MKFDITTWSQSVEPPDHWIDFGTSPVAERVSDSRAWFKTKTSRVLSKTGRQTLRCLIQRPARLSTSPRSTHRPALKCAESYRALLFCWFVLFCLKSCQKSTDVGEKSKTWQGWNGPTMTQWTTNIWSPFFCSNQRKIMPQLFVCDPNTTYWFMNGPRQNSHKIKGATSTIVAKHDPVWAINQNDQHYNDSFSRCFNFWLSELIFQLVLCFES